MASQFQKEIKLQLLTLPWSCRGCSVQCLAGEAAPGGSHEEVGQSCRDGSAEEYLLGEDSPEQRSACTVF